MSRGGRKKKEGDGECDSSISLAGPLVKYSPVGLSRVSVVPPPP